jgi:hypothetical protein
MIVYNLNYFKCYFKKNFMNVRIVILKKDIMEIVNLDFHILHTMKLIFFIKKNMEIFQTMIWRLKCCTISSNIIIVLGSTFKHIMYYIFLVVFLFFLKCHELWTT